MGPAGALVLQNYQTSAWSVRSHQQFPTLDPIEAIELTFCSWRVTLPGSIIAGNRWAGHAAPPKNRANPPGSADSDYRTRSTAANIAHSQPLVSPQDSASAPPIRGSSWRTVAWCDALVAAKGARGSPCVAWLCLTLPGLLASKKAARGESDFLTWRTSEWRFG